MLSVENSVGRLIELRVHSVVTLEDLASFHARITGILSRIQGRVVVCTDLRSARVFPPPVTDGIMSIIRKDGPHVERSAFLVNESAIFSMQIERVIREAALPARRAFTDANEIQSWLGELLDTRERRRLKTFLESGESLTRTG